MDVKGIQGTHGMTWLLLMMLIHTHIYNLKMIEVFKKNFALIYGLSEYGWSCVLTVFLICKLCITVTVLGRCSLVISCGLFWSVLFFFFFSFFLFFFLIKILSLVSWKLTLWVHLLFNTSFFLFFFFFFLITWIDLLTTLFSHATVEQLSIIRLVFFFLSLHNLFLDCLYSPPDTLIFIPS